MAEYIERAETAEFFEKSKQTMWHKDDIAATISSKKNIPAADVVEVVHGEWIAHGYKWRCSVCNSKLNLDGTPMENGFYFCPNCGSKMDANRKRLLNYFSERRSE